MRNLKRSLLVAALSATFGGCSIPLNQGDYVFNGVIEGEQIIFETEQKGITGWNGTSSLSVKKEDGRIVRYFDIHENDFRVDSVLVQDSLGMEKTISKDMLRYGINGHAIGREINRQFWEYLQKIKRTKFENTVLSTR